MRLEFALALLFALAVRPFPGIESSDQSNHLPNSILGWLPLVKPKARRGSELYVQGWKCDCGFVTGVVSGSTHCGAIGPMTMEKDWGERTSITLDMVFDRAD